MQSLKVSDIARVAHETNRAYCLALGDTSQPSWDAAPAWQKDSAVSGVLFQLRSVDSRASASHENWLRDKMAAGWTFGPVKDADLKEHPCMVPFENLPAEQQTKDHLFAAVVNTLLATAGEELIEDE